MSKICSLKSVLLILETENYVNQGHDPTLCTGIVK